MKKKLFRTGSGWALFMPKTILEIIELNPDIDELEITINDKKMIIEKAQNQA